MTNEKFGSNGTLPAGEAQLLRSGVSRWVAPPEQQQAQAIQPSNATEKSPVTSMPRVVHELGLYVTQPRSFASLPRGHRHKGQRIL